MSKLPPYVSTGADLSRADEDGAQLYRYSLQRTWTRGAPRVTWIMLNPSTADGLTDDPTIRRCVLLAQSWGYGGISVGNLFAYRATNPRDLPILPARAVGPDTDVYLAAMIAGAGTHADPPTGDIVVAAWGAQSRAMVRDRADRVLSWLRVAGVPIHSVGVTRDNHPRHPLMVRGDVRPQLLEVKA